MILLWVLSLPTVACVTVEPWIIVGGGIHGVHLATRLQGKALVVDPFQALLDQWKTRTAATGMDFLRSSAKFHLDRSPQSLRNMAQGKNVLASDYRRPRLDFFQEHCQAVLDKSPLRHVQAAVTKINYHGDHLAVTLDSNEQMLAERVVLALGQSPPCYPEWAKHKPSIQHILDTSFVEQPPSSSVAIIGGGLTAAHKALQLANNQRQTEVHLIHRHELREQQFDTHQDWMMDQEAAQRSLDQGGAGLTARQRAYAQLTSWKERRQVITKERIPGTITATVHRGHGGLVYALALGAVQSHCAQVVECTMTANRQYCLELSSGETVTVDHVLLATGFQSHPPGMHLVDHLDLPVSNYCGYPIVKKNLQWGSHQLYVMGALAELELGPSARNIAGARMAAERILS